jgi:2-pyrone-4,6-dicarboxylate lactonase
MAGTGDNSPSGFKTFPLYQRDTRAPVKLPPRGSCDCHVHVFDPAESRRLSPTRIYDPPVARFSELKRMHRALGIDRGVIVQATGYGDDHEVMLAALAEAGPNYRGVAIVSDRVMDADLARLHDAGVRAARFTFAPFLKIAPSPQEFLRQVARIQEFGWFIKVFTVGDDLLAYADLFKGVKVPIVFDHMGFLEADRGIEQPAFRMLLELVANEDRWVMVSNFDRRSLEGLPWRDMQVYVEKLIVKAPDRIIWCTDWPHLTYEKVMPNDADLLEFLFRCCEDAPTRQKVLVDNPSRLFGFS